MEDSHQISQGTRQVKEGQNAELSAEAYEAYLDIETTGLSRNFDEITVVGVYVCLGKDTNIFQFMGSEITADNILGALRGVKRIYTYNGKAFDLPFIKSCLGVDLTETFICHDLMLDCHRNNLYGGCKEVEKLLGIERQLRDLNGSDAIELWQRYVEQNDEVALSTLLEYNKEDVLMLKALREKLGSYSSIVGEENVLTKRERQKAKAGKSLSILISINDREYSESTLVGMEFVITGRLEAFSREEAEAKIKALGGSAKSDITRKTNYLVVGADPGSKVARAESLGVKQISESELLKLLGKKD